MLLVEARLGRSPIHGWGVFARQRIPAGTRTWEFVPGVDQLIDPAAVEGAREDLRNLLVHYTYLHPILKKRVLCGDITRFINHSETLRSPDRVGPSMIGSHVYPPLENP